MANPAEHKPLVSIPSATNNQREVASIAVCLMCDCYFMWVLNFVSLAEFRGGKGKGALEHYYGKLQDHFTAQFFWLRCPQCAELTSGKSYREWLTGGTETELSPSYFFCFGEDEKSPIYIDMGEGKPSWKLAKGVGPAGIQLHRSRSGRIYKNSLKETGLSVLPEYP